MRKVERHALQIKGGQKNVYRYPLPNIVYAHITNLGEIGRHVLQDEHGVGTLRQVAVRTATAWYRGVQTSRR